LLFTSVDRQSPAPILPDENNYLNPVEFTNAVRRFSSHQVNTYGLYDELEEQKTRTQANDQLSDVDVSYEGMVKNDIQTADQPGSTADQPGSTADQPGSTKDQPGSTMDQPGSTKDQPSSTLYISQPSKSISIKDQYTGLTATLTQPKSRLSDLTNQYAGLVKPEVEAKVILAPDHTNVQYEPLATRQYEQLSTQHEIPR